MTPRQSIEERQENAKKPSEIPKWFWQKWWWLFNKWLDQYVDKA